MDEFIGPAVASRASRVGRWAQWLSIGCAIHCMAMPLLVAVLPIIGMGFLLDERVETVVVLASLGLGAVSLYWGFRSHRNVSVLAVLGAAGVLILAGRLAVGTQLETALTVAGVLILAAGQFLNRRLSRSCGCGCAHRHDGARGVANETARWTETAGEAPKEAA